MANIVPTLSDFGLPLTETRDSFWTGAPRLSPTIEIQGVRERSRGEDILRRFPVPGSNFVRNTSIPSRTGGDTEVLYVVPSSPGTRLMKASGVHG